MIALMSCRGILNKIGKCDEALADLQLVPRYLADHLLNYPGLAGDWLPSMELSVGERLQFAVEALTAAITVAGRVYFMGNRLISNMRDPSREMMSLLAHPSFYNQQRYSSLLAEVPDPDNPTNFSYYFGQASWVCSS